MEMTKQMHNSLKEELKRIQNFPANLFKERVQKDTIDLSIIRFICGLPAEEDEPNIVSFKNKTTTLNIIKETLNNAKVISEEQYFG